MDCGASLFTVAAPCDVATASRILLTERSTPAHLSSALWAGCRVMRRGSAVAIDFSALRVARRCSGGHGRKVACVSCASAAGMSLMEAVGAAPLKLTISALRDPCAGVVIGALQRLYPASPRRSTSGFESVLLNRISESGTRLLGSRSSCARSWKLARVIIHEDSPLLR